jgi:hypothetical protein
VCFCVFCCLLFLFCSHLSRGNFRQPYPPPRSMKGTAIVKNGRFLEQLQKHPDNVECNIRSMLWRDGRR